MNYRGAFDINVQERWDLPWANYNPVNTAYPQVFTSVNDAEIPSLDMVDLRVMPNPASETATVRFSVPTQTVVSVDIYTMVGTKVMTILENYTTNANGIFDIPVTVSSLPIGTYSVQIRSEQGTASQMLTIVK